MSSTAVVGIPLSLNIIPKLALQTSQGSRKWKVPRRRKDQQWTDFVTDCGLGHVLIRRTNTETRPNSTGWFVVYLLMWSIQRGKSGLISQSEVKWGYHGIDESEERENEPWWWDKTGLGALFQLAAMSANKNLPQETGHLLEIYSAIMEI